MAIAPSAAKTQKNTTVTKVLALEMSRLFYFSHEFDFHFNRLLGGKLADISSANLCVMPPYFRLGSFPKTLKIRSDFAFCTFRVFLKDARA
jgi:hypothetical protein